ncbi:MAG: hypothetical protein ACOVLG_04390 [Flavobacterium sp.]
MKSNFRLIAYFIPLFLLISVGLFVNILFKFNSTFTSFLPGIFVVSLLFISIIVFFIEFRDKVIKVELINNQLKIHRFFGLMHIQTIDSNFIDGFHNSIVETKYGSYDYIYLMSKHKKVAKISNQYHKNFDELAIEIKKKYKDLGYFNTGFISEIKDIFN